MPAGEAFTASQRQEIARAVAEAERSSGVAFSVHVGPSEGDSRAYAELLHSRMANARGAVLVHVDPAGRSLDIVTGAHVRRILSNRSAALAAITMQSAFATGDLTRGLLAGIRQLGELARQPPSLHTDTP